jgi:type II secretion system protein N
VAWIGGALLLLAAALALFFPTDAVVRGVLARLTPAGMAPPAFEEARLVPGGLGLRKLTLARPAGPVVVTADRLDLWPSLAGLLTGTRGSPWRFDADVCGGTAKGTVTDDGGATIADVAFDEADLTVCPVLELGGAALTGRGRGTVHVRLEPVGPAKGNGQLDLHDVMWRGQGLLSVLRANTASGSWRLEERRLTLASVDVRLPTLELRGSGQVVLAEPLARSDLRLALTMTSADPSEPPRPLMVGGTLGRPQVIGR